MTALLDGGCVIEGDLALCTGRGITYRRILYCPVEKRKRRMVARWAMWYGIDLTCTGCGDRWQDGEMAPRPWRRAWRREAITSAKAQYATAYSKPVADKAIRAYLDDYFKDPEVAP